MNTCKATLRVLLAHRLYIFIYLVLIGIMMFSISGAQLFGSRDEGGSDTYAPGRPTVAVIDRDANRGRIAQEMREYLADSSDLVDLQDDPRTLQQAVASNWVDLIVIIPDGYAEGLIASASSAGADSADSAAGGADSAGSDASHDGAPTVETVTSYTSGVGAMASMDVSGFLGMTRTALIGGNVAVTDGDWAAKYGDADTTAAAPDGIAPTDAAQKGTGTQTQTGTTPDQSTLDMLPNGRLDNLTLDDLADAAKRVRAIAADGNANHAIAVDRSDQASTQAAAGSSAAAANASTDADTAVSGFGSTMKTALYPLFLAMTVCTALVLSVFNAGETRRRLAASPQRFSLMGIQRLATIGVFALIVTVGYLLATLGLMLVAGADVAALPPSGIAMTVIAAFVYALMTVACGFLLGECSSSDTMANGFANLFGLLIMFTSGMWLPVDMMPGFMTVIGRMLPGWWYCTAVDQALGIGTAAHDGVSVAGWAGSVGLVALFAAAFLCIGLAVGRIRRSRPSAVSQAVTQLAE
ncbi:ABC transporter permease [Bifidobacterium jacchi]|uniref:ABC transporter permease n=1 Tax=Bifidobacterium jacchi TaxID=2490545 RepID=A0A5N5RI83_9BIFI|nr:ABC transporter permease [Bifidobacterium jacchi]KAB5606998.1 ABC transporter permease [Bifidobacterium jacchi]